MKKLLALVLALVMTLSLCVTSNAAYKDAADVDYDEAVEVMTAIGVFNGTDGKFNPKDVLTREQAAKIVTYMLLGQSAADALVTIAAPFSDVAADRWSAGSIAYCYNEGILAGVGAGKFDPAGQLTGLAFAKMMLVALGYDAEVEGLTGANWSINVAKLALTTGLTDDMDISLSAPMTREQAAQMALNTEKATMVEYPNSSVVKVGDVEVTTSANASEVGNTAKTETIDDDNKMQFAENYVAKLVLDDSATDAYGRPANKWTYKSKKVGTYAATADATYTADVKLGTIYADLGLSEATVATVIEDGEDAGTAKLTKGNDSKLLSGTGNGTLVECYTANDKKDVTIVVINTYVDTVASTTAATASKDAYITLTAAGKFETDDKFEDDDVVLYTKAEGDVETVKLATKVSGEATKIVDTKSVDIDGTTYKFAANKDGSVTGMTKESKYDLYLDEYGYAIYADELEAAFDDYALVLAIENGNVFNNARVKLLTAAGKEVTYDTAKKYAADTDHTSGAITVAVGNIVTYAYDEADKEVTLYATGDKMVSNVKKTGFVLTNSVASIAGLDSAVYANSKTVFVVKDSNDGYKVYTGIKTVPDIKANTKDLYVAYYCKDNGTMATVMFIDASADGIKIETDSDVVIYLAKESESKLTYDKATKVNYYSYNAVVDGKIVEGFKVEEHVDKDVNATKDGAGNWMYGGVTYNANEIATVFSDAAHAGAAVGTDKLSGEYNVKLGTASYTVADDANIFVIDEDGEITKGSINSVTKDGNDKVLFTTKDGMVKNLFIQKVATAADVYTVSLSNKNPNATYALTINGVDADEGDEVKKGDVVVVTATANTGYKITSAKATVTKTAAAANLTVDVSTVTVAEQSMKVNVHYVYYNNSEISLKDTSATKKYSGAVSGVVTIDADLTGVTGYQIMGVARKEVTFVDGAEVDVNFGVKEAAFIPTVSVAKTSAHKWNVPAAAEVTDLANGTVTFTMTKNNDTGNKTITYTVTPEGGVASAPATVNATSVTGTPCTMEVTITGLDMSKNFTITVTAVA